MEEISHFSESQNCNRMTQNDPRLTFDTIHGIEVLMLMHMYELHRYIMYLEVKDGYSEGKC